MPDELTALFEAEKILSGLNPDKTTDPETLGLSGAINKRLFEVSMDKSYLNKALWFYSRGFFVRQDYYNGINTAFLHNIFASVENDRFESFAHFGNAKLIRKKVIDLCNTLIAEQFFNNRDDKHWVYLTLAEAYKGIDEAKSSEFNFGLAIENGADAFALNTYKEQIRKIEEANLCFNKKWKIR